MPLEAFTDPWLNQWVAEIQSSESYRRSAASWEWTLCLQVTDSEDTKAVFLDLWRGECRGAHMATDDDLSTADFVLAAPLDTWKLVLDSKLDPIFGVMTGKLKLARGNVAKLTPYMQASKDLVAAAAQIDTVFPD